MEYLCFFPVPSKCLPVNIIKTKYTFLEGGDKLFKIFHDNL